MTNTIEKLVRDWAEEELNEVNLRLVTLEKHLYSSYEPSLPPHPGFWARLGEWLDNLDASDDVRKKILFRLASELFFVGAMEFNELYRFAYNGPIARWLIDQESINLLDPEASNKLRIAVSETWFCPISDSMKINSFYHINNIPGNADYRPDWRSLAKLGDAGAVQQEINSRGIKRLVLIEDFVGGGSQMMSAVEYTRRFPDLVTLVVPLLICPAGVRIANALEDGHIHFEPIVAIPESTFISVTPIADEPAIYGGIRSIANDTYNRVSNGQPIGDKPYHPLGYPSKDPTGGLIVMHTNTPDNSLPLIHCNSDDWVPLFPRHSRV